MMEKINKNEWKPVDGMILEENALVVAKSDINMLVIAGPGAGKSELLAQRACYLLQTDECSGAHRILAVSFKKDAASNIQERVIKRCGKELGGRFDSMTFDAFAKSLVDQFLNAIPIEYRPKREYEIINDDELINLLKEKEILNYYYKKEYVNEINKLTNNKLPFNDFSNKTKVLWQFIANTEINEKCYLTFKMIGRLAEYLIRSNPLLKKVLNMTYSHIFLDEYQDTTLIQYELLKTCFGDENAVITAVGDDKQRIMVWAGALKDAFNKFTNDFNAKETMLIMNHRSAPRLLQIQKTLYNEFFYKDREIAYDIVNNKKWNRNDGDSYIHVFDNDISEAEIIATEINELILQGCSKNEICILVKQTPDTYCKYIIDSLSKYNIVARNEAKYQELLKEDLIVLLTSIMEIIVSNKAPNQWEYFIQLMMELNNNFQNDTYKIVELENNISTKINQLKCKLTEVGTIELFIEYVYEILLYIDIDKIKSKYNEYKNDSTLDKSVIEYCNLLWKEFELCHEWKVALEKFKGEDSIPIMTVHKSKGLEYECIFFIGLEDGAFWNFDNQRAEEFCAFFVALSRAKKRLDFTFSSIRSSTKYPNQSINNINEFYSILNKSGIVEIRNHREQVN